jgi:hypothetical protein
MEHRSFPATVVKPSPGINLDMLPVHGKEEGCLPGIITAGIPDQATANEAYTQMLTIDKFLGKLAFPRFIG